MATIIRIKRRLEDEPAETIVVAAKRARTEPSDEATTSEDVGHVETVLKRVATLLSENESVEKHLSQLLQQKKSGDLTVPTLESLKKNYKQRPNTPTPKELVKNSVKQATSAARYKLISSRRQMINIDDEEEEPKEIDLLLFDAFKHDTNTGTSTSGFGAPDDVITCNGEEMVTEKVDFVYDLFYTETDVPHNTWTQQILEIQRYGVHETTIDTNNGGNSPSYEDEDDENEEDNWRNDYPDEDADELLYESDVEEQLIHQMQKARLYDTDESYDLDEYDENADFDDEGNLLGPNASSISMLQTFVKRHYAQTNGKSDDDSDDD